ncbi:hypothetical protein MASR1M60_27270 [Rhodocyclaceae bacterium]
MNISTGLGVLLVGAALAGCANFGAEYGYKDGSRPGTVTKVGNDPALRERLSSTCRDGAGSGSFAMIRYTGNSHLRWLSFPVPDGMEVKVDDKVLLDVNACKFTKAE